jgi:hypothetical protein
MQFSPASLAFPLALALNFASTAWPGAQAFAQDVVKRGEALSAAPAKSVDEAVKSWKALDGKTVKVSGVVKSVCQQKGCWFGLVGKDGKIIRITSMGYKFFVPTNSAGKEAVVEGKFGARTLSASLAQHYEEDRVLGTSEKPKTISEPVKEFTLAATAVEIR